MSIRDAQRFSGAFPALPTPFDRQGEFRPEPLRALVRDLILQGVEGFYALGSTGESLLLSVDERKNVLETIVSEARGEATVIAHVGAASPRDALELGRHAAALGVDAISSVPPIYFGYTFEQIKRYYASLCELGVPVLLYNIPSMSGVRFTTAQLIELMQDPRVLGVKNTAKDYFQLERLRADCPDAILYNGFDETFLAGQVMGCSGGIGSTYNVMPAKFQSILDAVGRGDIPAAARLQRSVNNVVDAMLPGGVIPSLKTVLKAQGYDFGHCREPFTPLTESQRHRLLEVCKDEGVL